MPICDKFVKFLHMASSIIHHAIGCNPKKSVWRVIVGTETQSHAEIPISNAEEFTAVVSLLNQSLPAYLNDDGETIGTQKPATEDFMYAQRLQ
ncbi:hypothetical protein IAD21_00196 [Abditibacteriota bacterium]|nr:hypothetical protein IAD21_00196 [Abditibacteriota bacterium]